MSRSPAAAGEGGFRGLVKLPIKQELSAKQGPASAEQDQRVRFELYGEEIVEKQVAASGKSGRVYLPMDWLGKRVKIIRVN